MYATATAHWQWSQIVVALVGGLFGQALLPGLSAAVFTVTNLNDSGPGSFRQAILDANNSPGVDEVVFQIPGIGPYTIAVLAPLPSVTETVVMDATTQPGFSNRPLVELNGAGAGTEAHGLRLLGGNSTVRGLVINRFGGDGIRIESHGNVVQGNFIGVGLAGTNALGNGGSGVTVYRSSSNRIGGTNLLERNVISGGNETGIYIFENNARSNIVQGNLIGTTVSGTGDLGNRNNGIVIYNAPYNFIGGTVPGAGNVISGNDGSGIYLTLSGATGNWIQGNFIGTDLTGSVTLSNAGDGVTLSGAPGNWIGGWEAGARNVISGNGKAGVSLAGAGARGNLIQGNFIGTDVTGQLARGNSYAGVTLSGARSNWIGGTVAEARNVIAGNRQDGVFLTGGSSSNYIAGNYIGLAASGTNRLGNAYNGISVAGASHNVIGGLSPGSRNIISGNTNYGIGLATNAVGNAVQGNFIGTDASGRRAVNNSLSGIRIESSGNTIGGPSAAALNVISGNSEDGILLVGTNATGNVIQGNYVGCDGTGTNALRNGRAGIGISGAPGNLIGGTTAGAGNVLSGNGDAGVYLIGSGAWGNQIQGNRIGTDVTGNRALGNTLEGIYVERAPSNTVGGIAFGAGNIIAANLTRGIWLTNAAWNTVAGNLIGLKSDGLTGLGNRFHAVELEAGAHHTTIGGTVSGAANRIGFSQTVYAGVRIRDGATNNLISGNAIFSNGALGIDLGAYGVNTNDSCDGDIGANQLQNFPVLAQAYSSTSTGIRGTLNAKPNTTFRLEFFANPGCDGSGNGEGQIFLGETRVGTGANCTGNFTATFPVAVPPGYVVTATATDPANNTSEFSACAPVAPVPPLRIERSGLQQVLLSWPNAAAGFALKETNDLTPPVSWRAVTNVPILTNGWWVVTTTVTNGSRFYALQFE